METVIVVGAGQMGSQIGLVGDFAGHEVQMVDVNPETLASSNRALRARMASQVARGRRTADDVAAAFARIQLQTDLSKAVADATGRPGKFINLHFFNPALVMECVEVVRGPGTTDETFAQSISFVERLGKTPSCLRKRAQGSSPTGSLAQSAMKLSGFARTTSPPSKPSIPCVARPSATPWARSN